MNKTVGYFMEIVDVGHTMFMTLTDHYQYPKTFSPIIYLHNFSIYFCDTNIEPLSMVERYRVARETDILMHA